MLIRLTLVLLLGAGCTKNTSNGDKGGGGGGTTTPPPATADAGTTAAPAKKGPCDPATLNLGAVKKVAAWKPPAGCAAGGPDGRVIVASDQEFETAFVCKGTTPSGLDFKKDQLVVDNRQLSPAGVGGEIFDDGTKVTYVSHFRNPCPDDPQPMPMPFTVTYLLPAGAKRDFAEATCTVETKCK